MLRKLYYKGYFNYEKFIIENQKKLSISPIESVLLIKILDIYPTNKNITIDMLSNSILLKPKEIEDALGDLLGRGFISYELTNNKSGKAIEEIKIDGIFNIFNDFLNEVDDDKQNELSLVVKYVQRILNKVNLSQNDIDIIKSLVNEDGYTLADFKNACENKLKDRNLYSIKMIVSALSSNEDSIKKENKMSSKMTEFLSKVK